MAEEVVYVFVCGLERYYMSVLVCVWGGGCVSCKFCVSIGVVYLFVYVCSGCVFTFSMYGGLAYKPFRIYIEELHISVSTQVVYKCMWYILVWAWECACGMSMLLP